MADTPTREQVIAASNRAADAAGIPRLLLLAAGVAESNLRADARRPADPSKDAAYWPDVSYNPWQQTARWSAEYLAWVKNDASYHNPADFPGSDVIEAVFAHYRDLDHAATVAARQLKAHYRPGEEDAIFKALCRYNWPAGDGAPKGAAQAANYRNGITQAEAILGQSTPEPPSSTRYVSMPATAAGTLTGCYGVILHGSRSGKRGNPLDAEALGTARYCVSNPDGLSWNASIGPGVVYEHLDARSWGWNARGASNRYVAVEIAQPTVNDDPSPCAVAVADYIFDRVWPAWGETWHFPSHAELEAWGETGQKDGKTDLYPAGDERMNAFRERVYARLRERKGVVPEPEPAPPPTPAPSRPDPRITRARTLMRQAADLLDQVIAETA